MRVDERTDAELAEDILKNTNPTLRSDALSELTSRLADREESNIRLRAGLAWADRFIQFVAAQRGVDFAAGEFTAYALATPDDRADMPVADLLRTYGTDKGVRDE